VAACAVTALATVFSVQQGEHGPLVVYKLHVPDRAAPAAEPVPAAEPITVIPSRAPTVLGTVVMPPAVDALPSPLPQGAALGITAEEAAPAAAAVTWERGDFVTLKQVNDDIIWRRETADSLPEVPFAPRF